MAIFVLNAYALIDKFGGDFGELTDLMPYFAFSSYVCKHMIKLILLLTRRYSKTPDSSRIRGITLNLSQRERERSGKLRIALLSVC